MSTRARRAADWVSGRKRLEGFVDRVLASEVLGWAFDPNKPHRRVHIVAVRNGEIIAETLADLPRKDLNRHGKGDGRHGFNLRLPPKLLVDGAGPIRIEAAIGRRRILLRGGEIAAPAARTPKRPRPEAAGDAPCGMLERFVDGVLYGWARDPEQGSEPVVIDVYDDERYLGSTTAERIKPRLRETAPGAKAFQFVVPDAAPGTRPRLRARVARTGLYLRDLADAQPPRPKRAPGPARVEGGRRQMVGLIIVGDADADSLRKTTRSWTDQNWPHLTLARVRGRDETGGAGENVFAAGDGGRLREFIRECADLVFVRPGETLDLLAAAMVSSARPQADVLTWDIGDEAGGQPMRRRSEAWPLALRLGGALGGGFALRRAAAESMAGRIAAMGAADGQRRFELDLAAREELRWAHLPAALSTYARDAARPPEVGSRARAASGLKPDRRDLAGLVR